MISNYIQQQDEHGSEKKIIYVTKSKALAVQLKANWLQTMPEYQHYIHVEFMHYSQLLPLDMTLIEDEFSFFSNWLKELKSVLPYTNDVIWQEFRMISGLQPKESYLNLGKKQTQVLELDERQLCYEIYQQYEKYLSSCSFCSPSLYQIHEKDLYDLVLVDEAQDLSYCQLSNLNAFA